MADSPDSAGVASEPLMQPTDEAHSGKSTTSTRLKRIRLWAGAPAPGLAVLFALFYFAARAGVPLPTSGGDSSVVDLVAFHADPLETLWWLHIKPPLMTILIGSLPTDTSLPIVAALYVGMTAITVALTAWSTALLGVGWKWSAAAGALYAALPSTILFALLPTTLVPTALFLALVAFAAAVLVSGHPLWGSWIGSVAVVGAFWTRPSIAWPLALVWLLALALLTRSPTLQRPRIAALVPLGIGVLLVLGTQVHYVANFGIWSTSSWSGENVVRALTLGSAVSSTTVDEVKSLDPCYRELLEGVHWSEAGNSPSCLLDYEEAPTGVAILDKHIRDDDGGYNSNELPRLHTAKKWNSMMIEFLKREPLSPLRVAQVTTPTFLRNAVDYAFLQENFARMAAVMTPLKTFTAPFPVAAWLLVIFGTVATWRHRLMTAPRTWAAAVMVLVLVTHAVPSLIGEVGENDRFHAESYPVLVILAATAAGLMWRRVATSTVGEVASSPQSDLEQGIEGRSKH